MKCEEKTIFYKSGRIKGFPAELKDFDIILLTQTQPRISENDRSRYATSKEIATSFLKKPEYFLKNKLNEINTVDDNQILSELKKLIEKDQSAFEKNAQSNNCSELEIINFISNYLKI